MPEAPIRPANARAAYAPRENPKMIYLIAWFIISNHKPVGILDDFFEPKTNSSTEEFRDKIAVSPYSVVIMDILHCAVRRPRLYEGLGDNFLSSSRAWLHWYPSRCLLYPKSRQ